MPCRAIIMDEQELILNEGDLSVWRYRGLSTEVTDFLADVAWGTEGAVIEHRNTGERVAYITNPTLVAVKKDAEILATAVFCNGVMRSGPYSYNYYYVRYFAASRQIRGKGMVKHLSAKVMEAIRYGEKQPTIFVACVERDNLASYKVVSSVGYEHVGTFKSHGFSRFFPKSDPRLEQVVSEEGHKEVQDLLREFYREHTLVNFDYIFLHNKYFVIRDKGEIVAGCQAHHVHWVVNKMAGFSGKIIRSIVPYLPFIRRVFNPDRFEFLGFEGIYSKPGYEKELTRLFEAVLAHERRNSAMFWLGERSPVRARILKQGGLGLLHRFVKKSDVLLMTSYVGLSDREIEDFKSRPLYASSFDLT